MLDVKMLIVFKFFLLLTSFLSTVFIVESIYKHKPIDFAAGAIVLFCMVNLLITI